MNKFDQGLRFLQNFPKCRERINPTSKPLENGSKRLLARQNEGVFVFFIWGGLYSTYTSQVDTAVSTICK